MASGCLQPIEQAVAALFAGETAVVAAVAAAAAVAVEVCVVSARIAAAFGDVEFGVLIAVTASCVPVV